jgi:very-short-patch-repair endonuclease
MTQKRRKSKRKSYRNKSPFRKRFSLKEKQRYADRLRERMTRSEVIIWKELKRRQHEVGATFEAQQVICGYIPDFVERESMLIVEIDGKIHEKLRRKDAIRTANLRKEGYTVIRFTNEQAETRTDQVIEAILGHCSYNQ